jgi:hypothetical protein
MNFKSHRDDIMVAEGRHYGSRGRHGISNKTTINPSHRDDIMVADSNNNQSHRDGIMVYQINSSSTSPIGTALW